MGCVRRQTKMHFSCRDRSEKARHLSISPPRPGIRNEHAFTIWETHFIEKMVRLGDSHMVSILLLIICNFCHGEENAVNHTVNFARLKLFRRHAKDPS